MAILDSFERLNLALQETADRKTVLSKIASEIRQLAEADVSAVLLSEDPSGSLTSQVFDGIDRREVGNLSAVVKDPKFREFMTSEGYPKVVHLLTPEEIPANARELCSRLNVGSAVIVSIVRKGVFYGYMGVGKRERSHPFPDEIDETLQHLAYTLASIMAGDRASAELDKARSQTERILSMAPIGIMTCDRHGIIKSMNLQMVRLLGISEKREFIGTSVFEMPVTSRSGLDSLIMQGLDGHEAEKADVHIVPAPDKATYLHAKVAPLRSESGEVQGAMFVAIDMTSKVRLQNQLERSYEKLTQTYQELERVNRMKSQFIDVVSHELRTPLTVMRGYIDLMESDYSANMDAKFVTKLKTIKANTDKLYSLVESMLDVSRMEKGSLQIHPEPLKVDAMLDEIVKGRAKDAEEKKQTLTLEVEGTLPLMMADRRRLKDVLNNILDNALKYTQEGGRVQIGARDEGRILHIWVKDNGVGIPLENIGKLFDRFHIVTSNDLSHPVDRLGLGLPIAKGIIEAHGGHLWVESQVGKGSVFHIDLPKEMPGRV